MIDHIFRVSDFAAEIGDHYLLAIAQKAGTGEVCPIVASILSARESEKVRRMNRSEAVRICVAVEFEEAA